MWYPIGMSISDDTKKQEEAKSLRAHARHMKMREKREPYIETLLSEAMTRPRELPDGRTLPPLKPSEIVVFVAHKDDPCVPPIWAMQCEQQGDDVVVYAMDRAVFAAALQEMPIQYCDKCGRGSIKGAVPMCPECSEIATPEWDSDYPYQDVGKVLATPAPNSQIYVAIFSSGRATMELIEIQPEPRSEAVPA